MMATVREVETAQFWCIAGELRHAITTGAAQYEIDNLVDEVECMRTATDNAGIRARCLELLDESGISRSARPEAVSEH